MTRYTIHAINTGPGRWYPVLQELRGATLDQAYRALIEWSTRRMCMLILRDGATGKRLGVGDAITHFGIGFVDFWDLAGWLARTDAGARA